MTIGFIGLGIMGSRMAANLQQAGHQLIVHNRTPAKAKDLIANGAIWAATPSAVAQQCEVLFTMLSTPLVVKESALGKHGFLAHLQQKTWIDCSTVHPAFSEAMATAAAQQQVTFINAPVAGTKGPAEKGELVFFLGGEATTIAAYQALFDVMGKKSIHLGANPAGSQMKILVNQLLAQSMLAFTEAMALGQAMGLSQEVLFKVLLNVPVTAPFLKLIQTKLENGDTEANFPLKWLHKDLNLSTMTASEHGVTMPSVNATKEVFALAKQQGLGDLDFSAVYGFLVD